jgi:thiol-disulfide isomerase/thioredoxin
MTLVVGCNEPQSTSEPAAKDAVTATNPQAATTDDVPASDSLPVANKAVIDASVTTEELMEQARRLLETGKGEEAVALAESAVQGDPQNAERLLLLGQVLHAHGSDVVSVNRQAASGYFHKAADALRQHRQLRPQLSERERQFLARVLFLEARAYALENQPPKAIAALRESLQAGYSKLETLTSDPDLKSLRPLPEFQQLIAEAQAAALQRNQAETQRELAEHEPFDFQFSLPDLTGKTVSLHDFRGKVLIVDIWGTWCPPCRMEIPHFIQLYEKHRSRGLEIVGINYENGSPEQVRSIIAQFVEKNGVSYPCVVGDQATQDQVPEFEGFPTTLFVDREGVVRLKLVGYHPYEKLESIVLELLDRKPSAT